jgi:hypothetical protein
MTPYSRGRGPQAHWVGDITPFLIGVILAVTMLLLYFPSKGAESVDSNASPLPMITVAP